MLIWEVFAWAAEVQAVMQMKLEVNVEEPEVAKWEIIKVEMKMMMI